MAWALLVVGVIGGLLTINGLRSPRRPDVLATLSFFPGWLTSEFPFHLLACKAAATAVLVGLGALDDGAGWAGLAIVLLSWLGLVVIIRRSLRSARRDRARPAGPFMLHLAARGWVCGTANHRLSPKATFPDQLIDEKDARRWARVAAASLGSSSARSSR